MNADPWMMPPEIDLESKPSLGQRALRLGLWLLVLAALAGGGYYYVTKYLQRPPPPPPQVSTVPAKLASVVGVVDGSGQVVPRQEANLSFLAPGRVSSVGVEVGQTVKKGDVIANLDGTQFSIQVDQAKANLSAAQAKLEAIKAGPRSEEVAVAQAQRDAAAARLAGMQAGGRAEDVKAANDALTAAQAHLHQLQQGAQAADLAAAKAAVDQAQATLSKDQAALENLQRGPDPAAIQQAQLAVEQSKDELWAAQTARDGICGLGHPELVPPFNCAAGNARVGAAETSVQQAMANYQNVQTTKAHPSDVTSAQAAVQSAQAQLESAKAQLAQLQKGASPDDLAQASAAVDQARQTVQIKTDPYSTADLAQQKESVAEADAKLALAEKPYTPADLDAAQAAVDQAKAAVRLAQYNVTTTSLVAPFDGVVSAVNVTIGEVTSGSGTQPAIVVVDPNRLRLDVSVEETDIPHVKTGQTVDVSFDALPGKTFTGTVAAISPGATVQSGVATYTVSIDLQNADGVRSGMTGNAHIVYDRHDNVLVVPNEAVKTQGDHRIVNVLENGQVMPRTVTVGVAGDTYTEIDSGLKAGDLVVLPSTGTNLPQNTNQSVPSG